MAFLDKTSLIVDAVITDKGREKLSTNSFTITKFALGDDDIDYSLYNEANTNGPNYYGIAIENMPLLEAFTRGSEALRYKLTTRPVDSNRTPEISAGLPTTISLVGTNDYALIEPGTVNLPAGQTSEDYIFELVGSDLDIDFIVGNYAEQKKTTEHQVIIEQIYAKSGGSLAKKDMLEMKIDSSPAKPTGPSARITSMFATDSTHYIAFAGDPEQPTHIVAVHAEGEVYFNTYQGKVAKKLTSPYAIYPGHPGIEFVVNGSGFIQLLVITTEEEKKEEEKKQEEKKEEGKEGKDVQLAVPLTVQKGGDVLAELDMSRGAISEGVKMGILRANMSVFIDYETKDGRMQRTNATIASINAKQDKIQLRKSLSKAIPKIVHLVVE